MKLTVVGCSPAWPNPGGAQSGYLLEGPGRLLLDCGPGVLARLRSNGSNGWPKIDAIAITHFHLDHWGDLVPWVWGAIWGLGSDYERPELWLPPGGRDELAAFGPRFGTPDMFARVFEPREYEEGKPFEAAGLELTPMRLPHYTVQTYGFRVSNSDRTLAYSGDSAPSKQLASWPRTSTSSSARPRWSAASSTASPAATSPPTRRSPPSKPPERSGSSLTHRPKELRSRQTGSSRRTTASN